MGHAHSSEVVPFKATVWEGEVGMKTGIPTLDIFLEAENDEDFGECQPDLTFGLWTSADPAVICYGEVVVTVLAKGDKKVFYINEDSGNGNGYETCTFFSENRDTLQEFLTDWGFDGLSKLAKIQTNRPVDYYY